MKRDYDLKAHKIAFNKGDPVYVINKTVTRGLAPKLNPVWSGPHIIIEVITPWTYRIKCNNRSTMVVNHDRLKFCRDQELPRWITKNREEIAAGLDTSYCICGMPYSGTLMIQCDSCLDWFHGKCVNVTPTKAKALKEYFCKRCNDSLN